MTPLGRQALLAMALAILPVAVHAQLAVSADLRGGLYTSVGGMGTVGVTRGRLRSAPAVGFGVDLGSPTGLFGVRFSAAFGISSGTTFRPTTQCTNACGTRSIDAGAFMGAAVDLVGQRQIGRWSFRFGAGPGIVSYYYGDQGFTALQCPTGSMCDDAFRMGATRVAFHTGGTVARRFAGVALVVTLEDYISRRVGGGASNDLSIGLGAGMGSLWRRR